MQEVGYYREEEDEPSDKQLTTTISTLIDREEYTQSQDSTQMSQEDTQMSQDSTQMSQDITQMSQDITQMSQDITQMSQEETDRSHVRNVISETYPSVKPKHTLSFTTDNARDISKALKSKYQWLGCSAHNINLVIKEALKKFNWSSFTKKMQENCFLNKLFKSNYI